MDALAPQLPLGQPAQSETHEPCRELSPRKGLLGKFPMPFSMANLAGPFFGNVARPIIAQGPVEVSPVLSVPNRSFVNSQVGMAPRKPWRLSPRRA